MTVQIEEGKFYKTRDGRKVGPVLWVNSTYVPTGGYWMASGDPRYNWWPSGRHIETFENPVDIVAEWCEAQTAVEGMRVFDGNDPLPDSVTRAAEFAQSYEDQRLDAIAASMVPDIKAEIADEAKRIVSGARRAAYGTPESNFERIARFWQSYFENTGRSDIKITAGDVSPMMRLMKEARLCETPDHRDSFIDIVGYALTGAEVNQVASAKTAA